MRHRRRLALLSVSLLIMTTASANDARQITMSGNAALSLAEQLYLQGALDEAEDILTPLAEADAGKVDTLKVNYLTGLIAVRREDHKRAATVFASILKHDPSLGPVRLDYARALYAAREDRRAEREFRRLLQTSVPAEIEAEIRAHLRQIRERRVISVSASAAIVPDTNINTATDDPTQWIGGVEQELNDDGALQRSGLGLSSSLAIHARPRLGERLRGEVTARLRITDQENEASDYVSYGIEIGPRMVLASGEIGLSAIVSADQFAGDPFATSAGMTVEGTRIIGKRTRLSLSASVLDIDYRLNDNQDGLSTTTTASVLRAAGRGVYYGLTLTGTVHDAVSDGLSYWRGGVALNASVPLPEKISVQAVPAVYTRRHQGELGAFGETREDVMVHTALSAMKRDLKLGQFLPRLTYSYTNNQSNIDLYDFDRHRVDIGLARDF